MCLQCCAKCQDIGEIIPGLFLSLAFKDFDHIKSGDFCLIRCNDPDVVFDIRPWSHPLFETPQEDMIDHPLDLAWNNDAWVFRYACAEQLDLSTSVLIGEICSRAGWSFENCGPIEYWLFNKIGKCLESASLSFVEEKD